MGTQTGKLKPNNFESKDQNETTSNSSFDEEEEFVLHRQKLVQTQMRVQKQIRLRRMNATTQKLKGQKKLVHIC